MEMLRKPLSMTEDENRRAVLASEKRREWEGHPEGNRRPAGEETRNGTLISSLRGTP